ncbi:MAG TPA: hypothetical protein DEA96_16105 [Leptospiraceae bacterium]|nr:hypothetical protein [Spirochaetaceae bacterium]HBS06493.1 hypothetical protein [Leptospiraceae bacterium]
MLTPILGFAIIIFRNHIRGDPSEISLTLASGLLLFFVGAIFSLPAHFFEFRHACFKVEILDNKIICENFQGKRISMAWQEIVAIAPTKRFPLSNAPAHLRLIRADGTDVIIHHNLEPLVECVHEIEQRSPNLKSIDYGGLDRTRYGTEANKL